MTSATLEVALAPDAAPPRAPEHEPEEVDVRKLAWSVVGALCAHPAAAQSPGDLTVHPEVLLGSGEGGGYREHGVGAPTVAYDPGRQRYLMVFEVRLPEEDPRCPVGLWALGLATSPDGLDWAPLDAPLLSPEVGTYYACVAAHPTATYLAEPDTLTVLFKAEQGLDVCEGGEAGRWGCGQYTGVGKVRVLFGSDGEVQRVLPHPHPVLPIQSNFGFPRAVRWGQSWYLMFTVVPDAHMATSPTLQHFEWDGNPVLQPGSAPWAVDELYNPALVCHEGADVRLSSFVGGRDLGEGGGIEYGGWGEAVSTHGFDWLLGAEPLFEFWGDERWRHWDVLRVGDDDYLVWFSEKDEHGRPQIRFASTVSEWSDDEVSSKQCER